jgi:hypothetical protein
MSIRRLSQHLLGAVLLSLAVSACGTPSTPTVDPQIYTQTAAAADAEATSVEAARLTAQAKLNQQLTPTETPTTLPTRTPRPTETPTQKIVLSPTPTATALPTATVTNTSSPYVCTLIEQTPRDGTTVKISTKVTVRWTVKNSGPLTWAAKNIDFAQTGGDKIADPSLLDLPHDVKPGETIDLSTVLKMPDRTGQFRTDWKLAFPDTGQTFCPLYVDVWSTDK